MSGFRIFNIERCATEDGYGIRTVVFLKGCGLRCKWCANPESQKFNPEILFKPNMCVGCGRCVSLCKAKAIRQDEKYGYISDMKRCTLCGTCIHECYCDARQRMGTAYSTEELLKEVLRDQQYFKMSGGGITFSGGEPLFYAEAIVETAAELKQHDINTLIETCGHVPTEKLIKASKAADYIFYDIKQMDSEKHRLLTGKPNDLILSNLQWLSEHYQGKLSVRYPYIPGCNDGEEDIEAFFKFVKTINTEEIVFLPYHRLGIDKYKGLGRDYKMGDMRSLKKAQLEYLKEKGAHEQINVKIQ